MPLPYSGWLEKKNLTAAGWSSGQFFSNLHSSEAKLNMAVTSYHANIVEIRTNPVNFVIILAICTNLTAEGSISERPVEKDI